jgi:3-hydroxyacyl-[acyl-carrier-protein] dehydratase
MERRDLDINEIKKIIPHRYPFLLIDKIEKLDEGKSAIGYKNVSINEYFFQGHFPVEPIMPGVLIIEALAQVGAVVILSKPENAGKIAYFGGINKAKFRRKVVPGDVLRLEVEITKTKGNVGIGMATAYIESTVAAQAELVFAIS